jgi:hypothetical protein
MKGITILEDNDNIFFKKKKKKKNHFLFSLKLKN